MYSDININDIKVGDVLRHKYRTDNRYDPDDNTDEDYECVIIEVRTETNELVENKSRWVHHVSEFYPINK